MAVRYEWRGDIDNEVVERLSADLRPGDETLEYDWKRKVEEHSLGWVCAKDGDDLVGFVNVAWDGGDHAFLLDTRVAIAVRRQGIGQRLVEVAVENARAAGCEWLHVDFDNHLLPFYFDACGFVSTNAGLTHLQSGARAVGRPRSAR
jgi:predicted N-acetyltransferase YhbS